jgi:CRP-like cAMP-binding protein
MTEPLEHAVLTHPFLQTLTVEQRRKLIPLARLELFVPGQFLLREGETASASYLVCSGKVALEVHAPPRGTVMIETVGAYEAIGWSWMMAPYRWHFDARAVHATEVIHLDGKQLRTLCDEDNALGYHLVLRFLGVLQERLERVRLQLLDVYQVR